MNAAENNTRPWEDLDNDLAGHVSVVPPEEEAKIDGALGLQMISIRLQKGLLSDLKEIASFYEVGYQPLIRDLLNRFVLSEKRNIIQELLKQKSAELKSLETQSDRETSFEPIDKFLERERKVG